ncbi:MAG TPA: S8/S53 family peptidase, partial [Actinomycetota bacterium]|nr:S8/S53 family peptidase [Actinomycetota bacterium]
MKRAGIVLLATFACASVVPAAGAREKTLPVRGLGGDATVIAVIDSAFSPYHWDYVASQMPQAKDSNPRNDLPLSTAPHEWLDGFPGSGAFDSYNRLDLTLEESNPEAQLAALDAADEKKWAEVKPSSRDEVNYYWMPGTKVVGALDFGGNQIHGDSGEHGMGTASVSVGNIHGTCPECLLVFISYSGKESGEAAIEWALDQPWIDGISNSYGFSTGSRDRIYSGSDTQAQRRASERGQTIFFSAGNGQANTFTVPNTTTFSSQEGPDWIVTVGAVSPGTHASYSGHGKPADIAGIGSGYPASYGAASVSGTGEGGFGGTSNATPTIAGTYGRALYMSRVALPGPSRIQSGGTIAVGGRFRCAKVRPDCELGDSKLTVEELRNRLFKGAVHSEAGTTVSTFQLGNVPPVGEEEFLSEGHGSYYGRETGKDKDWLKEFDRIMGPLEGRAKELKRPQGERDWFIVDSYCRQSLWGFWRDGYFVRGKTELPGDDPDYPVRSSWERSCAYLAPPG